MSKIYALGLCCLLSSIYQNQQLVNAAPPRSDRGSIIVIPFKQSDKQISKIKSFKIDSETAVKQLSLLASPEAIIKALANIREFDVLIEGLDAITVGDVYRAVFPNGILHTVSQNILRSPIYADTVVFTAPTNKLEEVIQSEIASTNQTKETNDGTGQYNFVYDEVIEEGGSPFEGLKEEPITDDYVYDQPIEDRFRGDVNIHENEKRIDKNLEFKDVKHLVTDNQIEVNRDLKDVKPLDTGNLIEENNNIKNIKYLETTTIKYEKAQMELLPLETSVRIEENRGLKQVKPLVADNLIGENHEINNMKPLETTTIRYEKGDRKLSKYGLLFRNWLTEYVMG